MSNRTMESIKAAITRFDKASQDYAFIGSQDPEDRGLIEQEHTLARESLERMIERSLK